MIKGEFKYHEMTSTNPYYNLAMEEFLLKNKEENFLLLWRNEKSVIVGVNQLIEEVVALPYAMDNGIKVARRNTGGGAVYHDLGNLNYSIITDYDKLLTNSIKVYVQPILQTLGRLGLKAVLQGKNDILVEGRKVSGCAQKIYGRRILHHGCILIDTELETMFKVLQTNNDKLKKNEVDSIYNRVGNVKRFLNRDITQKEFADELRDIFSSEHSITEYRPTKEDMGNFQTLTDNKYITPEWIYGHPISYNGHVQHMFKEGFVDIYLDVQGGIIENIHIYGDFMARKPMTELTSQLRGCRQNHDEISKVMLKLNSEDYLGNIDIGWFISMICSIKKEDT